MGWTVYNSDGQILQGSSTLADDAVTTAKILDANVTLAKIASQAANTVLVRDANSSGVISAKAITDTQILIGDGTGFTAAALSGDVTMANSGATTIATDAVDIAMLSATGTASSSTFLRGDNAWVVAGGDLSFGGDTFTEDKVIGSNDAYSLSFETAGVVRMKIHGPVTSPTSAGAITMPYQPGVLAYNSVTDENVSGNATTVTVDYDSEIFDQGGDFLNDVFTAPVTGRYLVNACLRMEGLAQAVLQLPIIINSSNYTWHYVFNQRWTVAGVTNQALLITNIIDMDANDTVHIELNAQGVGSDTVDIIGETASGGHTAWISIMLVA